MQRTLVILAGTLILGASAANPPNSSDIVFIDGQPCNRACQSYLDWSHKVTPVMGQPERVLARPATAVARRVTGIREQASKRLVQGRPIKRATAVPDATEAEIKDSLPASNAADVPATPNAKVIDALPGAGVATDAGTGRTLRQVTAATAVAERLTAAATVAIVIARPDIKSVSDLTGKAIAIDDKLLDSSRDIEIAMTAAGAREVRVNQPEGTPSEPVIDGAVPAAVLTLVSRDAADAFPEISGFKIFRIPLTPQTPQAKVADSQPAQAFAAEADPRATKPAEAKQTAVAIAGVGPRANLGNSSGEVARLMARASALLSQGNIIAAREVLGRAAETGSARASFSLAETYDPFVLAGWKVYGTRGDPTKARELYAKAEAGGIEEAKARFEALAASAQR